ncbi:hypothetical protein IWZ00DRAFT_487701 [Phyllosticta capitalensis]|uniref:F-box domain-containing protein n=1 Tax=Phyllosticta capitalensis TaxID=121624 RepID=A0ABR1YRK1_9PEZI
MATTKSPNSISLLGDMPLSIFHMELTPHLADSSKVALSLACRAFHQHLGHTTLSFADHVERRQFLQTMLRAYPELMICHDCGRFHSKATTLERRNADEEWLELVDPCRENMRFRNYGPSVEFFHVQLVMDRHFFSPAHGIPLSALRLPRGSSLREPVSPADNFFNVAIAPRIVGGELVIKARFSIWREDNDTGALFGAAMKELERDVCPHLSFDAHSPLRHCPSEPPYIEPITLQRQLPELRGFDFAAPRAPLLVLGPVRGCEYCCTDYQTTIIRKGRGGGAGWQVEVVAWQCFGAGRSPEDPKWMALAEEWWFESARPAEVVLHEAGSVRRAYEECVAEEGDGNEGESVGDVLDDGMLGL